MCAAPLIAYYTIPRTVRELQRFVAGHGTARDYTIPRTVRELQLIAIPFGRCIDYTIPRTVRELQPRWHGRIRPGYYTIPRTVRELQRADKLARWAWIIPYQELLGNYNTREMRMTMGGIIPYQELPGVYQRGETPATYPFFQNKMRALFSAFSLFFACT